MWKIKKSLALIMTAIIVVCTFPGCGDDGGTNIEYTAPDIPPMSSFLMDFSDFAQGRLTAPLPGDMGLDASLPRQNWTWAASNVLVWNTLITFGFAIPVAAFLESFNHEATRQPNGSWLWDYNFTVGVIHLAELYGKIEDDDVVWEMYISREGEGGYTDFLWFSGRSALDGSQGTWTLYQDPDSPTEMIGITWHRDAEAGTADIRYTNIVPGGPEYGGYIHYGVTGGDPYDAFYDIYNKGKENHTNIEWNIDDKYGRVKDPAHFLDQDWYCWNGALDDTLCAVSK
ncbi:hypothetical protein ACFL2Z_02500 [Candidatus Eisenbacteria bacterium]|uniref:Lipoprotein n=1 Tax=Eiseniibacteriota bacterium TaxID=2212470 RepID=A0ABV6YNY0_UNCEI